MSSMIPKFLTSEIKDDGMKWNRMREAEWCLPEKGCRWYHGERMTESLSSGRICLLQAYSSTFCVGFSKYIFL